MKLFFEAVGTFTEQLPADTDGGCLANFRGLLELFVELVGTFTEQLPAEWLVGMNHLQMSGKPQRQIPKINDEHRMNKPSKADYKKKP